LKSSDTLVHTIKEDKLEAMKQWVLIDTETTGITNPIHIIEIYAQRMMETQPIGTPLHLFINHNVNIPPEATAVHGYTNEFVSKVGINPWKAHKAIENYIGNRPVCSHNLSYDWDRCLLPERRRLKVPLVGDRGFCTVQLFRRCLPAFKTFKLEHLRQLYNIQAQSHSAKGDVITVLELFRAHALPKLKEIGVSNYDQINEFSKINPIGYCRNKLSLPPLLTRKPTLNDILFLLSNPQKGTNLKEGEIEIINTWVSYNLPSLGIHQVPQEIETALETGNLTSTAKKEILELIQPLLPLNLNTTPKPRQKDEPKAETKAETKPEELEDVNTKKSTTFKITNNKQDVYPQNLKVSTPAIAAANKVSADPRTRTSPSLSPSINHSTSLSSIKGKRGSQSQSATTRQINYLKALGVKPTVGITKKEASKLIDETKLSNPNRGANLKLKTKDVGAWSNKTQTINDPSLDPR
jgi:DNA polymerase III epsilon subunit-like protein